MTLQPKLERGVCEADKHSLNYVVNCIHYNKKGCPRDCKLYKTLEIELESVEERTRRGAGEVC